MNTSNAWRRWVRIGSVLALVAGCVAAMATPARATVTLRIEPALVQFQAKPGAEGSQTLTLSNDGDEPIDVAAAVEPYKGAAGDLSAVAWLTIEPSTFRLEPGATEAVEVAIRVPDGLKAGGRYALVTFTTGAKTVGGSGTGVAGKLGAAFLFEVKGKGKLNRQAKLERFAPVLEPDGRIGFRALLTNEGNLHVFSRGEVVLAAHDGTSLGAFEVPATTALLPGGETLLGAVGSVPLPPDRTFEATATIDYGAKKPATATVTFQPTAALAIERMSVCENLDRGPTLTLTLRNDGELGLQPRVQLTVRTSGGTSVGVTPGAPVIVWPGETTDVAVDAADRLASGEYVLAARADPAIPDQQGRTALPPVEAQITFQIGGLGEGAAPLCAAPTA